MGAAAVLALLGASYMARQRTVAKIDPMTATLRTQAISLKPADIGLAMPAQPLTVYGVVIDLALQDEDATLVALSTGDASLYFENGGGLIGGGSNSAVTESAKGLVALAQGQAAGMKAGDTRPPRKGDTRITFLTTQGPLTEVARERSVADGSHRLSGVYYKANEVVTVLRQPQQP